MTTFSNDPVRVSMTLDDVWNICHAKGIDSTFYPVPETNETEFYVKLTCSDTNPWNPTEEKYKEDLEREFERLHITQDNCREFEAHKHFNNKKIKTVETILDEKVFGKDNRYDILIDKFHKTIHMLPNGKRFITVEEDD